MVKVPLGEKELYLDGYLKSNMDDMKKVIKNDWDHVILVDGMERSGKSVLAQQIASYAIDKPISLDNIAMDHKDFVAIIKRVEKGEAVIYDEGFEGLTSRAAMSRINRMLVKCIAEIGQKNLFVFVVMPSFFDLDKYYALHRGRCLLHVYTDESFNRGYFAFYGTMRKTQLYVKGKQYYNYGVVKPNFRGRFAKGYMVDEAAYRKKKLKALEDKEEPEKNGDISKYWPMRVGALLHILKKELDWTWEDIMLNFHRLQKQSSSEERFVPSEKRLRAIWKEYDKIRENP